MHKRLPKLVAIILATKFGFVPDCLNSYDKRAFALEHNECLNGEITAEVHTAHTTLHRLMVYFWNFLTKMRNAEAYSEP